jgi:hypothetical protein
MRFPEKPDLTERQKRLICYALNFLKANADEDTLMDLLFDGSSFEELDDEVELLVGRFS